MFHLLLLLFLSFFFYMVGLLLGYPRAVTSSGFACHTAKELESYENVERRTENWSLFLSCGSLSLPSSCHNRVNNTDLPRISLVLPLSVSLSLSVCLFLCAYIIAQDFEALDVGSLCLHLCLIVSPARHLAINQSRQTTAKCRMLEFCKLLGSVPHGHSHWEVSLQCPPSLLPCSTAKQTCKWLNICGCCSALDRHKGNCSSKCMNFILIII